MSIREATSADIPALHHIRMSVKENVLHNPLLVTPEHYTAYLETIGKGWLFEAGEEIAGFAIIDNNDKSIWALFVHPHHEGRGIGKQLHDTMLNWHFSQSDSDLWLSTAPGTRAEKFYTAAGWTSLEILKSSEIKFGISFSDWKG